MATAGAEFRTNKRIATRRGRTRAGPAVRERKRKVGEEMSDHELVALLGRKIHAALNNDDGDLSELRKTNFNGYIGAEYGNEREGYSKFVTREIAETVEWVMPNVLRVFLGGDKVVSFEPKGPDDEERAERETTITQHMIDRANNGSVFLSLHHWFKDCLMYPNGYIKVYMDERKVTDVSAYTGLDAVGVQYIDEDPYNEILEKRERREIVRTEYGAEVLTVYDLKVRCTKTQNVLRIDPVPPDECLVDNDHTSLDLDESPFVCHRVRKSFSKLVEEGFDRDELENVGGWNDDNTWNDERVNRLFFDDEDPNDTEGEESDPSMRMYWVHECTLDVDFNGDGLAEFRKVTLIGDKIFENEEIDYQPMISMSSILMAHKHTGMSFVDLIKDLQLLMTTLVRQLLDNIYKINVRRKYINEDALTHDGSTMEALLNTQAEYVPVRGRPLDNVMPEQGQSIVAEILPVIQQVAESRSMRSGVAPETSIDPGILQETKVGTFTGALEQASMRVEMLVRIFAETGMRKLAIKVHQLMRQHWDIPETVKVSGEWIPVDPQGWRNREDVQVNVGLGFNNKQQQLGLLTRLLEIQKEAMGIGLADQEKIFNALDKLIRAANLGDSRLFFIDPNGMVKDRATGQMVPWQPPQPPPDPNMILAQAQAQALGEDTKRKGAETRAKIGSDVQKQRDTTALKRVELSGRDADRALKSREIAIAEYTAEQQYGLSPDELLAKIANIDADTELKAAQRAKTTVEALATGADASELVHKAEEIVKQGNEDDDDAGTVDVEIE